MNVARAYPMSKHKCVRGYTDSSGHIRGTGHSWPPRGSVRACRVAARRRSTGRDTPRPPASRSAPHGLLGVACRRSERKLGVLLRGHEGSSAPSVRASPAPPPWSWSRCRRGSTRRMKLFDLDGQTEIPLLAVPLPIQQQHSESIETSSESRKCRSNFSSETKSGRAVEVDAADVICHLRRQDAARRTEDTCGQATCRFNGGASMCKGGIRSRDGVRRSVAGETASVTTTAAAPPTRDAANADGSALTASAQLLEAPTASVRQIRGR